MVSDFRFDNFLKLSNLIHAYFFPVLSFAQQAGLALPPLISLHPAGPPFISLQQAFISPPLQHEAFSAQQDALGLQHSG
jgi:hypothetical protein